MRLRQQSAEILRQWEAKVRVAVPAARRQDRPALYDCFPLFLEEMVHALLGCGEEALLGPETSREHAEQRSSLRTYTLDQVVLEYRLMRDTVLEALWTPEPLQLSELRVILDVIDTAISEASVHYFEMKTQDLRGR